ncbi:MAG: type II toxin-antitoxin system Phd/YefM family antitoxin [Candidatus Tectomicrobia bacterium]|nr:type II toxin-antitoxin system Phd/YefM family antitoxin [Candidatus Tectomicrobia bacterium]
MKILSLSEAKMKLSALVEALQTDDEEVIITKNGRPAAVLVSPNEYESWQETQRVLSDAELMAEIQQGLEALKEKHVALYTLEELFEENPKDAR